MAAADLDLYRDGLYRATIAVKHRVGSQEIAMTIFRLCDSIGDKPSRKQVMDLVREMAHKQGSDGLWPECGVEIGEGYEADYAPDARRAVATVRRLWPELDDSDLANFERMYAMPGVDL